MDEEVNVKAAPVTRLRRRLSVEPEDSPLPTTPSTPNKKRSTRLVAKPQLDLIDEIATDNVPKLSTRKAAVKDGETDASTPTPVTPSRRSTRIRSNTSILSETITQSIESPRAKRALRRKSLLGSDTETTVLTPVRQTRRTRKDSTTSVDKQAATDENVVTTATSTNYKTIIESEKEVTETSKENATNPLSPRKSPRLNKKGGKAAAKNMDAIHDSDHTPIPTDIVTNTSNLKEFQNKTESASPKTIQNTNESQFTSVNKDSTDVKKNTLNNTSDTEKVIDELKTKRNRTKSWTTLASPLDGSSSENESTKEKLLNTSISGLGANLSNDQNTNISKNVELVIKSPNRSINKSKSSLMNTIVENKENLNSDLIFTKLEIGKSDTVKLFEKSPDDQNENRMVLMEDSDSSSCVNHHTDIQNRGEDQCVPIGKQQNELPEKFSQGVEPMDIDESVLANVTFDDFSDKSTDSKDIQEESEIPDIKIKSSISKKSMLMEDSTNKSKRKSSVSISVEVNNDSINKSNANLSTASKEKNNDSKIVKTYKSFSCGDILTDGIQSQKSLASLNADTEQTLDQTAEKSKRKSSISFKVSEAESKNESIKSVSYNNENNAKQDDSFNKSKRKSSISLNMSNGKNDMESKESAKNSSRNPSISANDVNGEKVNESLKKSNRKSSISDNIEKRNNSLNKSDRKSYISELIQKSTIDENNDSKISNKSLRNSFLQTEPLEKSGNENKSTLVISQLKESNDTNAAMSPNVTNNEFSKYSNGLEIKNKGIDKKNLSMNCLTSTPIQQKPLHKLAMQLNTSLVSPTVNKSEVIEKTPKLIISNKKTSDSDSSQDEMDNIKHIKKTDVTPKNSTLASPGPDLSDNEFKTDSRIQSKKLMKKSSAITLPSHDSSESSDEELEIKIKKAPPIKNDGNGSKVEINNEKSPVDSSESDDSDEVSKDESGMLDDEASEASDDYQSGDSRDEEERRYEAENEIVDKGETLDSDEVLSNDSDYEKDSFLVSSDAEDSEMLSGTGDDLSMSDHELNMSAKSKKKFNDRKIKQQKKASREMYEARHKNEDSSNPTAENSKSAKTKKPKRQRLESSTLESDTEKPKTNARLRIDSSQEGQDKDTDDETVVIKKKSKPLFDSISKNQIINEKEIINKVDADDTMVIGTKNKKSKRLSESMCHDITINEKDITRNQSINDPLSVAIKQEPKTPQKFDMSIVAITEDIEEIQVDSNASFIKQNETTNPLQVTIAADNYNESSSSDEGEFAQNYDSVLSNLSKHKKIIKSLDASLDLNKKTKKSKNPVIDQLNLTQTKTSKKNKKDKSVVKSPIKVITEDAYNSSDSIDMKLLFPEDSNDSEIHASQFKPEEPTDFIPLKRAEAKTNILENMDKSLSLNKSVNMNKKDKNRKLSQCDSDEQPIKPEEANEEEDTNCKIIIDTTGTHQKLDDSLSKSSTKKKNKNKSLNESRADTGEIDCTDGVTKTPIEIFFTSEKKKKNKNKSLYTSANIENSFVEHNHSNFKTTKQPKSKSEYVETQFETTDNTFVQETPTNVSIKKDKKKKKKADVSQNIDPVAEINTSVTNKSQKSIVEDVEPVQNIGIEVTPADISLINETKKRRKTKKNKNLEVSHIVMDNAGDDSDEAPVEISYKNQKKSDTVDDKVHTVKGNGEGTTNRKRKAFNNLSTASKEAANFISITNETKTPKQDQYLDSECISAYDAEQGNGDGTKKKSKKNKISQQQGNIVQDKIEDKPRKRKRHDDSQVKTSKVPKQSLFDEVHIPTLPESVLNQLPEKRIKEETKRNKTSKKKVAKAISTAPFVVEEVVGTKNKPSNYLEQSVYLDESPEKDKKYIGKQNFPKVLPFTPTVSTSESGYTTKFNINVLPNETQFVAQSSNVQNFKEAFLGNQRIKKMGTFEHCKKQRSHKLSKF